MRNLFLFLILSVFLVIGQANAATKYVSPNGTGDGNSVDNPDTFTDAYLALRSIDGNHVIQFVEAGTYYLTENLPNWGNSSLGDNLTLEVLSGLDTNDIILDGNNTYAMPLFSRQTCSFVASNITFQNMLRTDTGGAALFGYYGDSFTVTDCRFIDNLNTYAAADCAGAAIYMGGQFAGNLIVSGCYFSGNVCDDGSETRGRGCAIYAKHGGTTSITNSIFINNSGKDYGGAVAIVSTSGDITISNNKFTGNTNTTAGAVCIQGTGTNILSNNVWTSNSASTHQGGALLVQQAGVTATITNDVFKLNTAPGSLNTSAGGAIKFSDGASGTVQRCFFQQNSAAQGGSIDFGGTDTVTSILQNNVFDRNSARGNGGAWQAINNHSVNAYNNTYYGNTAINEGHDIRLGAATGTLRNEIHQFNSLFDTANSNILIFGETAGTLDIQNCDIEGGANAVTNEDTYVNNINSDPLFRNISRYKFTLKDGSPCLNAGTDVLLTRDHNNWLIVGTPSIGAYQYTQDVYQKNIGTRQSVNTKTSTGMLSCSDSGIINVDCTAGDISLYLPPLTDCIGLSFIFSKADATANTLTVLPSDSGGTIDGAVNKTLDGQYNKLVIIADDNEWRNLTHIFPATSGASGAILKRDTANGTEWATSLDVTLSGFTPNRAIYSDGSGNLESSPVTQTELELLHNMPSIGDGSREAAWVIYDSDAEIAVGDGKQAFPVPASWADAGLVLTDVTCTIAELNSAASGATTVVLRRVRVGSRMGDDTSQFDLTDQTGNVARVTWDGTGTDPGISASTLAVGDHIDMSGWTDAGNNGHFVLSAVGDDYFEYTNASLVADADQTSVTITPVRHRNMTSTGVTVGYNEYSASDATVDTANDDVKKGDAIYVDVDAITTAAQKGLSVTAVFEKP